MALPVAVLALVAFGLAGDALFRPAALDSTDHGWLGAFLGNFRADPASRGRAYWDAALDGLGRSTSSSWA